MSNDGRTMTFQISNLKERPEFCVEIADRVWNAWWRDQGVKLEFISGLVRDNLGSTGVPFALVAHDGDHFLGTASVIESDMEERPDYTPWVAAVWVDTRARGQGIGQALVLKAAKDALSLGRERIYLCATVENSLFYERMGWRVIERDVADLNIFVMDAG